MQLTPRQTDFADAALRVLVREGMAAVSFRTVAAEAALYERFEAAIERTAAHLEEAADMLAAGRGDSARADDATTSITKEDIAARPRMRPGYQR